MKKMILLLLVLTVGLSLCACDNKGEEYQKAMQLLELGNYQEAAVKFVELGNYKDSADMVQRIKNYQDAHKLLADNKLEDAYLAFSELGDFLDAEETLSKFDFRVLSYTIYDDKNTFRTMNEYTYHMGQLSCLETKRTGTNEYRYATYYQYDSAGNVEKEKKMSLGDSDYTVTTEYDYDHNGNKVYEYFWYTGLGVLPGWYYYSYDEANNLIREEYYTSDTPYYVTTYEYDENNQITRECKVSYRNNTTEEKNYENTYNEGRLISRISSGEISTYEYDAEGKLILETIENQQEDSHKEIRYEYDSYGNMILKVIKATTSEDTNVYYHVYEFGITYTP